VIYVAGPLFLTGWGFQKSIFTEDHLTSWHVSPCIAYLDLLSGASNNSVMSSILMVSQINRHLSNYRETLSIYNHMIMISLWYHYEHRIFRQALPPTSLKTRSTSPCSMFNNTLRSSSCFRATIAPSSTTIALDDDRESRTMSNSFIVGLVLGSESEGITSMYIKCWWQICKK